MTILGTPVEIPDFCPGCNGPISEETSMVVLSLKDLLASKYARGVVGVYCVKCAEMICDGPEREH